jgi:hypothetical protein
VGAGLTNSRGVVEEYLLAFEKVAAHKYDHAYFVAAHGCHGNGGQAKAIEVGDENEVSLQQCQYHLDSFP